MSPFFCHQIDTTLPWRYYSSMNRLTVRLPKKIHERVSERAEVEGVSMNVVFINLVSQALDFRIGDGKPDFWGLSPEQRVSLLLEGYGKHVTGENQNDQS